ncbi:MAG: hypothetical protein FJ184_14470, partial [Gammaproteobacteria bacterium]|nr:hypothetical protein [Gammaproteobacteria bacterium]
VPLQRVLEDMQERKTGFALAIIDACRNNPFRERGRAIGGRGLAATNAATGQMVLYSAGTGQKALDRLGPLDPISNGVFTRVLLREMQKPGVPVADVLRNVREVVAQLAKSVGEEQVPAIYDQSLGRFYFTQPVVAERIPDLSPTQLEERFWDDTKAAGNKEAFEAYLKSYPSGRYADLARANIVRLTTPVATAPPPVVVAPPQPAPALSAPPAAAAISHVDAGYAARIRSAIRANTVFKASGLVGNPQARFLVTLSPSCEVLQVRLEASSGNKAWDEAAEQAIVRTSPFPRPPSGPCDRSLEISHRPRKVVL